MLFVSKLILLVLYIKYHIYCPKTKKNTNDDDELLRKKAKELSTELNDIEFDFIQKPIPETSRHASSEPYKLSKDLAHQHDGLSKPSFGDTLRIHDPAHDSPDMNLKMQIKHKQDHVPRPNLPIPDLPIPNLPIPDLPIPNLPILNLPIPNLPIPKLPIPSLPIPNQPIANRPIPPDQPIQQRIHNILLEELKMHFKNIQKMVYHYRLTLTKDVPTETDLFLKLSLESSIMEGIPKNKDADLKKYFNEIQKLLHDSFMTFNDQFIRESKNGLVTPLDCYRLLRQNPILWSQHLNKRSSNFLPLCSGWTFVMSIHEKIEALLLDYIIFLQFYSEIFRTLLYNIRDELLNDETDLSRKTFLKENIDKLQFFFSLYRFYKSKLIDIYKQPNELKIILIMVIYDLPICKGMENSFNQLIGYFMNKLGLTDLSRFFDSRISLAKIVNNNFVHFENAMNKYRSLHLRY